MSEQLVIPFGKYKGKPVEVLQADGQYVNWLMAQEWFSSRFPAIHTLIVNNFAEPQDSPEHNALQVRFLDSAWLMKFLATAIMHARSQDGLPRPERGARVTVEKPAFEERGWDVVVGTSLREPSRPDPERFKFWVELKPCLGDDYPSILRQIKSRTNAYGPYGIWGHNAVLLFDRYTARGASLEQVRQIFWNDTIHVVQAVEIEA